MEQCKFTWTGLFAWIQCIHIILYMILTIKKCSALLEIIYQRERVDLFGKEEEKVCTYPRSWGSRSFSLNDPESLSDMLALKWEKTLLFMKRKIDRQHFRKMINSYQIFNPNVLLVFLLLLPFSLRKTVYHDHHQELLGLLFVDEHTHNQGF